jgi:hypothetical protein
MDKKLFGDLVTSLEQARRISCGSRKPSRVFHYPHSRVKAIRGRARLPQDTPHN